MKTANQAGVDIRYLGIAPLFDEPRAYAGPQNDWIIRRADPSDGIVPAAQQDRLQQLVHVGLDFPRPGDVDNHRSRPEAREVQAHGLNHLTRSWPPGRIGACLQGQREPLKRQLKATNDPGKLGQRNLTALSCGPFRMNSQVESRIVWHSSVHPLQLGTVISTGRGALLIPSCAKNRKLAAHAARTR